MTDWETVVAKILGSILTLGIVTWLFRRTRGAARPADCSDLFVLRYSPLLRGLFVAELIVFPALLAAIYAWDPPAQWDPPSSGVLPISVFGGLSLLALLGLVETVGVRIEVSSYGVFSHTPWRGPRHLAWHQVARVSFVPSMMWFVIQGHEGTRIRVSKLLTGIPTLGEHVRRHLEEPSYADAAPFFDSPVWG